MTGSEQKCNICSLSKHEVNIINTSTIPYLSQAADPGLGSYQLLSSDQFSCPLQLLGTVELPVTPATLANVLAIDVPR